VEHICFSNQTYVLNTDIYSCTLNTER